jgi:hypothetical protein
VALTRCTAEHACGHAGALGDMEKAVFLEAHGQTKAVLAGRQAVWYEYSIMRPNM